MALPQDIRPVNSEIMDSLVRTAEMQWKQTSESSYVKVLFTGAESGTWVVLYKWLKGHVAQPHKHLAGSHTFILSGSLRIRDAVLNAGDYVYEANGMLHDETEALEDTEYLFICNGPIIYFDGDRLDRYKSWEDVERLRQDS